MTNKEFKSKDDYIKYLKKINFKKHLKKIEKILKDKKIVIYGAGIFFEIIQENYDLSNLNIIAISDRKFSESGANEKIFGYPVCALADIAKLSPDYVLVGTIKFIKIIQDLESQHLKDVNCIIKPLINKPFFELLKEFWSCA